MATFQQRMGLKPQTKPLQLESMDAELRNGLWNVLEIFVWRFWEPKTSSYYGESRSRDAEEIDSLIHRLWFRYFKEPLDTLEVFDSPTPKGPRQRLRGIILSGPWATAYDIIDFIAGDVPEKWRNGLARAFNVVLERENSGYRFVSGVLVPITSAEEIASVETAIEKTTKAVGSHLDSALAKLADRQNPDYRNSIKESISAVEAACQSITGRPKATLGQCLGHIQKSKKLHGAFTDALQRLYGYTSDSEDGIRHAMTDGAATITKADAQLMLVLCSAFINYLWSVAAEHQLGIGEVPKPNSAQNEVVKTISKP